MYYTDKTSEIANAISNGFKFHHFESGPGSGKTTFLIEMIEHLYHQNNDLKITCITFTNRASNDFSNRLRQRGLNLKNIQVSTIHKLGKNLSEKMFGKRRIVSDIYAIEMLKRQYPTAKEAALQEMLDSFAKYRETMEEIPDFLLPYWNFYSSRKSGKIDMVDMVENATHFLLAGNKPDIDVLMVDEFQDTSKLQLHLIDLLIPYIKGLITAGDFDQSIYNFRGANPEITQNWLVSKKAYIHENPTSRRCFQGILDAATSALDREKTLHSAKGHNPNPVLTCKGFPLKHIKKVIENDKTVGILSRTRIRHSDAVARVLSKYDIPYQIVSGVSRSQSDLEIIYAKHFWYITKALSRVDFDSIFLPTDINIDSYDLGIVLEKTKLGAGVGAKTITKLSGNGSLWLSCITSKTKVVEKSMAKLFGFVKLAKNGFIDNSNLLKETWKVLFDKTSYPSFLDFYINSKNTVFANTETLANLIERRGEYAAPVQVLTAHSSKGLEWDIVIILNFDCNNWPHSKAETEVEISEEGRLVYVAISRAKEQVYFHIKDKNNASPYFQNIQEALGG